MSETKKLTLPVVEKARQNDEFRHVIWTGEKTQLVLMAIPEGGEIGADRLDRNEPTDTGGRRDAVDAGRFEAVAREQLRRRAQDRQGGRFVEQRVEGAELGLI